MHTFNPSIWKPDAGQVISEFRNSLDYKERPCLKKIKSGKNIYTFMCCVCTYVCMYTHAQVLSAAQWQSTPANVGPVCHWPRCLEWHCGYCPLHRNPFWRLSFLFVFIVFYVKQADLELMILLFCLSSLVLGFLPCNTVPDSLKVLYTLLTG